MMATMPCDIVQEYEIPLGVTAIRIKAESGGSGGHSSGIVTLQVRPGATVRLRFTCLRAPASPEGPGGPARGD